MKSGIGRPLLHAAVLLCAILETTLAHGNVAVALCGAAALVLSGWAIPLLDWRPVAVVAGVLRPRGGAWPRPNPGPTTIRPRVGLPPAERRTSPPRTADALAVALGDPSSRIFPAPPRFGPRGAVANGFPWLLPRFTAPGAVQADEAELSGLRVRAASVVGPGHRCQEPAHPRQDAYRLGRDADGRFLIIAVADGLSSGARSEMGADVAVRHAVDALRDRLHRDPSVDRLDAAGVFGEAAGAMTTAADQAGLAAADVCAVLVTAVVDSRPDERGERPMWVGWIGDASVWSLRGRAWEQIAGDTKSGAQGMASNAVHACLPQRPDQAGEQVFRIGDGDAIAVVTDGIGDAMSGIPEANTYLAEQWARPPALGALLNDICFDARQHLDDRTAVVLWTPELDGHDR